MRTPNLDMSIFKDRRDRLGQRIRGSALLLAAHPHLIRNNDVHYPFRQDSNLFYMTGLMINCRLPLDLNGHSGLWNLHQL